VVFPSCRAFWVNLAERDEGRRRVRSILAPHKTQSHLHTLQFTTAWEINKGADVGTEIENTHQLSFVYTTNYNSVPGTA
jgi:hypothetical protein